MLYNDKEQTKTRQKKVISDQSKLVASAWNVYPTAAVSYRREDDEGQLPVAKPISDFALSWLNVHTDCNIELYLSGCCF